MGYIQEYQLSKDSQRNPTAFSSVEVGCIEYHLLLIPFNKHEQTNSLVSLGEWSLKQRIWKFQSENCVMYRSVD